MDMARANIVSVKTVRKMFGLYVVVSLCGSFKDYDSIHISKTGTVIGTWGSRLGNSYRDYLRKVPCTCKVICITDNYIVLKP